MKIKSIPVTVRSIRKTNPKPKEEAAPVVADPIQFMMQSRLRERQDISRGREQLAEMICESQRKILAMRAKGNIARLKIVNKALDN